MTKAFATAIIAADDDGIAAAARLILDGQPVAIPTETVYGLAADATNGEAVARIYAAKGRPSFNPLIVHVLDLAAAEKLGKFSPLARTLAKHHWPGPLTLVVPRRADSNIASLVTAGLDTIAFRVPAHPAMRAVLRAVGRPLAAPSANASGRVSPVRADHVAKSLGTRIPLILDGGKCEKGLESTIVAAIGGALRLLRPGPVVVDAEPASGSTVEAPGMLASHYAPAKPVRLDAITPRKGEFLIGFGKIAGDVSLSETGDLAEAAARLFDLLHEAEDNECRAIAIAPIPNRDLGVAINNRLERAAAANG